MLGLLWFFLSSYFLNVFQCEVLKQPTRVELLDNEEYTLTVEYCNFVVYDDNNKTVINMTTRCYCYNNECSIPGPTFVMYSDSNISLTLVNNMKGSNANHSYHNTLHDPDVTNIHLHGVHIGSDDENLLANVNPNGDSLTYNYHIINTHYPGTMWYHPHWHGSVEFQLLNGLFGAVLIDHEDKSTWDTNLVNMKEYIILLQYIWTTNECNCNNVTQYSSFSKTSGKFRINNLCFSWCSNPNDQRSQSGLQYNMNSDNEYNNKEIFLINGQYQPYINDMNINEYYRLRIINSLGQYYMQISFPTNDCEFYFMGRDGIFFDNENNNGINRDISLSPYYGEIFIAPGGRIDVIVKCSNSGIYEIKTSTSTSYYSSLSQFPRPDNNITLFSLHVNDNEDSNSVSQLVQVYPSKPDYLENLLNYSVPQVSDITCINYNSSAVSLTLAGFELTGPTNGVNNEKFDEDNVILYMLSNEIYEYEISTRVHPYHQHNYPFQVTDDDLDGFIIQKGDWVDTIGFVTSNIVRQNNYDFNGDIIVHCHFLNHEDQGMMGIYQIVDSYPSNMNCTSSGSNSITFPPTISSSQIPSLLPTNAPSNSPSNLPTNAPSTINYSTRLPTYLPIMMPTNSPTIQTNVPTLNPTNNPTVQPTNQPITSIPTLKPTSKPTNKPTHRPTSRPTNKPTKKPTNKPTKKPTKK